MQNQHLPWSLKKLADEELADALTRFEEQAKTGNSESIEILVLANALLWTGRALKDVPPLQILVGTGDPSGNLGFHPCTAVSTLAAPEWRIRALPVPFCELQSEPVQRPGTRLCLPVFILPDYADVDKFISRLIGLPERRGIDSDFRIFQRDAAHYNELLRTSLSQDRNGRR